MAREWHNSVKQFTKHSMVLLIALSLYDFRDTVINTLAQSREFHTPRLFRHARDIGISKLRIIGGKYESLSCLDTVPVACDRQTDGQRKGQTSCVAILMSPRGKNV